MTPTIKDVALKAKVSVATVSRVLNDLPGYSEDTRQRVMRIIGEIGYQPNALARGLVSKKTHTIGILMPNLSGMVSSAILEGIEDVAHASGLSVIVCNTDNDGERTSEYLQVLQEKQVDGMIVVSACITPEDYGRILAMKKPVVLVSTMYSDGGVLPYVKVDDEEAAFDATKYLIRKGHRKIAMIAGTKTDGIAGIPRVEGYKRALRDSGLPVLEHRIAYGDFRFQSGMECFRLLLETTPEITAVFAASDEMAAGVLSMAYRMRVRVPEQISVIGYDNTQIAEMTVPPLTTLGQPFLQMGQQSLQMLLESIEQSPHRPRSVILPHQIVERETVKDLLARPNVQSQES